MVRSLDDTILVERHLFGLMDLDVDSCPNPWPQGPMPPDVAVWAQPNRVDFRSVGEDHVASVRFEAWDEEPDEPDGEWTDRDDVTVPLSSGKVKLWALTDGPSAHSFRAGPPGQLYALRVWSRGQDEMLTLVHEGLEIPDGTEQYVLQFRPIGAAGPQR